MVRDVCSANPDRFRLFCPDQTNSNRLDAVFELAVRASMEHVTGDG
jgi:xylulose-5-phosphate/fructose-6-phosphate phosphoketolase